MTKNDFPLSWYIDLRGMNPEELAILRKKLVEVFGECPNPYGTNFYTNTFKSSGSPADRVLWSQTSEGLNEKAIKIIPKFKTETIVESFSIDEKEKRKIELMKKIEALQAEYDQLCKSEQGN